MSGELKPFEGTLPYASELVGIYQPLLGWKSNQSVNILIKETAQAIQDLYDNIVDKGGFLDSSKPGSVLNMNLNLEESSVNGPLGFMDDTVVKLAHSDIENFIKTKGRIPNSSELRSIFDKENMLKSTTEAAMVSRKNDRIALTKSDVDTKRSEENDMDVLSKDSDDSDSSLVKAAASAGTMYYASKYIDPKILKQVLESSNPWKQQSQFIDPLADFDSGIVNAVLSPVGLVHLYRQYFFEFDSFLGPPVGHIWITPGGTLELVEVNTRRILTERTTEIALETLTRSEKTIGMQEELSDAIRKDNESNTQLGVTASGGGNGIVYHGEASANFGLQNANKLSQESIHKSTRQQSEKLTSEIKRNFKTTFRTMTETEDTSSRRYLVQNTTDKLVNYELRRKMRKVGVQVQHIGTQLCWQIYIDDPGKDLGIAELVHIAKKEDIEDSIPPTEAPPVLESKETNYQVSFPYQPLTTDHWHTATYTKGVFQDMFHNMRIEWHRKYTAVPPAPGYKLAEVQITSTRGSNADKWEPKVSVSFTKTGDNEFQINLDSVDFEDNTSIEFVTRLIWNPPAITQAQKDATDQKSAENTVAKQRKTREEYLESVRDRIKIVGGIRPRPFDELRAEERIIVYRQLIQKLMQVGESRVPHVTSELIRGLFDIDKMLYFVAAEWWMPRQRSKQQIFPADPRKEDGSISTYNLTPSDKLGWGGIDENRESNYLITEESEPAHMGSSLGWLLQIDGDEHRNAFLNSPWIKAIIPIRQGRESAALKWLKLAHVEGSDGLDAKYGGPEKELRGKTIEEVLDILAKDISELNTDMDNYLTTETVYEKGFNPLDKGFRATGKPYEIFDQWIEVLPTDQVVAKVYEE